MKSNVEKLVLQQSFYAPKLILVHLSPNVPTTTTRNVYLFSVVQLKGKHCQKPHCHNGVVDTFGQYEASYKASFQLSETTITEENKLLTTDSKEASHEALYDHECSTD